MASTDQSKHHSACYLICVYNDRDGLEQSLKSVFADDPLADILILDDGSRIPVTLPDSQPDGITVHLLRQDPNQGLIAALNKGAADILDRGYKYIARLDAADTVEKGRIRAQLDYMEAHPGIALLGTQLRAFDSETNATLFHFNNPCSPKDTANMLKRRNCIAHPSVMIRTEALKQCGLYDHAYKHAEDYELWRRIETRYGVANLPDIYVNKEISPHQVTAQHRQTSNLCRLKIQLRYFKPLDPWCWIGVMRSVLALAVPRTLLLRIKSNRVDSNPEQEKTA